MESLLKDPSSSYKVCTEVLIQLSPHKKKYILENNKPSMKKISSKAIMIRTKLRNRFLKNPLKANRFSYMKQINCGVSLLRKETKQYFVNIKKKNVTDNKTFWQTMRHFLSEKLRSREKLFWLKTKNGSLWCRSSKLLLEIPKYEVGGGFHLNMNYHPTLKAILIYRNHPSVISITFFS